MPPQIRTALAPDFPGEVLDSVRWTLAGDHIDLGSAVAAWYGREGGAITLDDVIVFSDPRTAANLILWAHELTHAMQYEQLGTGDFARLYAISHWIIEDQAWRSAFRVAALLQARRAASRQVPADSLALPATALAR